MREPLTGLSSRPMMNDWGRVERADRSRPRLTEVTLVPPERSRHGHLRPRVLSWRNGRIRLVRRCLAGLQVLDCDQRRRFSLRAAYEDRSERAVRRIAGQRPAPFPDLATAD